MNQNFTLENYKDLLEYFGQTHKFTLFKDYNEKETEKIILLRHDIDYSLKYAYEIAKMEAQLGVKSTYFLLFSSPFYNMLDEENISLAQEIANLGHEIGLHYDVTVISKGNRANPQSLFDAEINLLANLIDTPIRTIAMHNPSISGDDIFRESSFINTYDEKFVKEMAYFSDSCMAWRDNFIKHLDQGNFPSKIQLLIHPILWTKQILGRYEKLDQFFQTKISSIEDLINDCRKIWKDHSGVIEHDRRQKHQ
ncbi:MAG: hypothetical protein ABJG68_05650 [Crocinitomicaceae bacterium]